MALTALLMQSSLLVLCRLCSRERVHAGKTHKVLSKIDLGWAERLKHSSRGRHERPCSSSSSLFSLLLSPRLPAHTLTPAACWLAASLPGAEPSPALLVASCSRRRVRKCSKEGKEAGAKADEANAPKIKGKPGRKPKAKPGEAPPSPILRLPEITGGSRYPQVVVAKPPEQLNKLHVPAGWFQKHECQRIVTKVCLALGD